MESSHNREKAIADLQFGYSKRDKEEIKSCNICGGVSFIFIAHRDRYGYPARSALCESCGITFLSPRMTSDEYNRFYQHTYRPLVSAFHGRIIDHIQIQDEQQVYAEEIAEFLSGYIKDGGSLLDIGGSTGVIAAHFKKEFSVTALCLDPSATELQEAKAKGLDTVCSMVEKYEPSGTKFDTILMCQTIDHLLDVRQTMEKVRNLIEDNGRFFVDIVDFRAAYLRNRSVEGAIKIDHPYYFVRETIVHLLSTVGFEVIATNLAKDKLHIGFVCAPGEKKPFQADTGRRIGRELFDEIRHLQNFRF